LDDVLVFSKDWKTHLRDIRAILSRLKAHGLYCNLSKCRFFVIEVDFLGFIVGTHGIRIDPSRVESISKWPTPKSYTEVQVFLRFCNFYRRFIEAYSRLSSLIIALLKGSKNGKKEGLFI